MMAVKMPLVNVGPQVSADVCKGDGSAWSDADGEEEPWGGGEKWHFADILYG